TIRPSAVVDIIGKFLTPILLVILAALVIIGILNPIGEISSETLVDSIAKDGILAGYQTMDVLVSLAVTLMLVGNAARKGYNSMSERMSIISKASAVALLGLGLVYGGLTYLGATTSSLGLGVGMSQTGLVVMITETLLGKVGVVLLSLIVFFACLTTAIGLVSAAADFFSELSKGRVKYGLLVALICIFAAVIANVGISMIISLASPVLNIIYPVLLTQTVLSFFDKTIKNHNVNRAVAIGTFIMAIFGVLADLGAKAFDFVYALPLAEFGFFWLVPAVVAGVIGAFVPMTQPKA
ncbi:MAG: branched-chain amino acid transport system II carrier protein, partial [Clostridia bacterium]|nr:branched-chain amino acid transport system II carrier protein [Clostridia bacterium]